MPSMTPFSDNDTPVEIIERYHISKKISLIYIGVMLITILFIISLYVINPWIDQPEAKNHREHSHDLKLIAPVNGRVTKILINANQEFNRGDTLLLISSN